jgi:hypothetical protein
MKFLAVVILFFLSVFGMDLFTETEINGSALSATIGVSPGPKLDKIMTAFWKNGYDINTFDDLLKVTIDAVSHEELRSFGLNNLHLERWNNYKNTGNLYLIPKKEDKENFKTALSLIIGVLPGPKLDEIMNALFQNGYNSLMDLNYIEDDAEIRSLGFRTLYIKRCKDYCNTGNIYMKPKEKASFKIALSCIIGVPSGPKLDEIVNALSQNGYNSFEDLEYVENGAEFRSFGFRTLHIKRCKDYCNTGNPYIKPKEKYNFKIAIIDIIGVLPGRKLDKIMNAFFQNGYNSLEDLEFIEDGEELRSFGLKGEFKNKLCFYLKKNHVQDFYLKQWHENVMNQFDTPEPPQQQEFLLKSYPHWDQYLVNLDDIVDISQTFQKYEDCNEDVMKHMKQILRQKIQELYKNIPNPKMFKTQPQEPIWNPSTNLKSIAHSNVNPDDEQLHQIQKNSLIQADTNSPFRISPEVSSFTISPGGSPFTLSDLSPFALRYNKL